MKSKFFALFAVCLLAKTASAEVSGTWTQFAYKNSYGERNAFVYVPQSIQPGTPAPLLVMLHGCGQTAAAFAMATQMNALADVKGFVVLYPEQDKESNPSRCWNWFSPENFVRGGGELGIITGMVEEVQKKISIDSSRIGVAGFSAGAALTSNLLACHSDVFSVGVLDAGLEYKAATSIPEAFTAMSQSPSHDLGPTSLEAAHCTGAGARMAKLLVIQGTGDTVVNPKNAGRIIEQFSKINDLLDDGEQNGSQSSTALSSQVGQIVGGRSYQVISYGGNGHERIQEVLVNGMPHAWSGSTSGLPFTDATGPHASQMAVELLFSGSR